MKFGVVTFPGSNCDEDMVYVLQDIMGQKVEQLWHKDRDLKGVDFVVLPGGFSYGDYLRSGAIARFSPIMSEVLKHAERGAYVLGICNGFQILTESHLLPGALLHNSNRQFICDNVYLRTKSTNSIVSNRLDEGQVLKIPIAHAEGRFYAADSELKKLPDNNQILFEYCDAEGNVTENANPNGPSLNIAGICNEKRNVIGMMPHPERAADLNLGNTDGALMFESIVHALELS